jgi:hypothetical protein
MVGFVFYILEFILNIENPYSKSNSHISFYEIERRFSLIDKSLKGSG